MKFIPFFLILLVPFSRTEESTGLFFEDTEKVYGIKTDPIPIMDAEVQVIPFKRAGRLIIIEAEVDSLKGNFIFDTGAPYLVLNKTYFRNYRKRRERKASGITGNSTTANSLRINQLNIRKINYSNIEADVVNLGEIENARGIKILGLLGLNLFKSFEIEVDINQSVIRLYKIDEFGQCLKPPSTDFKCEITQPITVYDNTIFTQCTIAGKSLRFGFDTGAETNALNSRVSKKILETISLTGRRRLSGVGDGNVEILIGRLNDFKMGESTIFGMQTLITNMDGMDAAYGTTVDGMLGFDFLAKGIVRINCRKKYLKLCLFDKFSSE